MTHAHTHAQVHEAEIVGDLPDEFVRLFAEEWQAVEERIKRENDLKVAMLARVRALHGPIAAQGLKAAMRILAQDPAKRVQGEFIDKIARRYLRVIEGDPVATRFNQ